MSTGNPHKAVLAIMPDPITTPHGVVVLPLSLATFSILERMRSPILTGQKGDVLAMLPSLYVLCHPAQEVHAHLAELEARAIAWAEAYPPAAIAPIEVAAREQVTRMLDVIAEEGDGKKKATTAGSPP